MLSGERIRGWVAEWSMAAVLKTARGQPLVGSNPDPIRQFVRLTNWKGTECSGGMPDGPYYGPYSAV